MESSLFPSFVDAMPLFRLGSSDAPAWSKTGLAMDMVEQDDKYVCTVDVPGLNKEEVHLSLDKGVLSISADFAKEKKGESDKAHWVERSTGHVSRSVKLPEHVDEDAITAAQENGVLTVQIPKKAQAKRKTNRITIN